MSWNIRIERTVEEWDWSGLTYNLNPMLREGGVNLRELDGKSPSAVVGLLRSLRTQMIDQPHRFRALNPPNRWGDYEGCLRFVDEFTRELERAVAESNRADARLDDIDWRVIIT